MRTRAALLRRVRSRQADLEKAVYLRVQALSGDEWEEPEGIYAQGLREAVAAALEHCLSALESGDELPAPAPAPLLAQARLAAREGIELGLVFRRCVAGHALLGDLLVSEARSDPVVRGETLRALWRDLAATFDRLIEEISTEYRREQQSRFSSPQQRVLDKVRRLLAGEPVDPDALGYALQGWHVALVLLGASASSEVRALAAPLDRRLLVVPQPDGAWAWIGGRAPFLPAEPTHLLERSRGLESRIAIGEPGLDAPGWRLSHRQALAALPLTDEGDRVVRYGDVALLASVRQDSLLMESLQELYLAPLQADSDGGGTARTTLRAYFHTGRRVSAAAAALGVNRHTVTNRLRAIEARLGHSIDSRAAELEAALRLHASSPGPPGS